MNEAHSGCNSRHDCRRDLATAISVSSTTFVVITDRASTLSTWYRLLKSFREYRLGTFTFLTVATDAMEYFQEEVMGRKEERITFLRKFLPFDLLHREIDGNDANFPRKLYFRIETRMKDYARFFFFIKFFLRVTLEIGKLETFLILRILNVICRPLFLWEMILSMERYVRNFEIKCFDARNVYILK